LGLSRVDQDLLMPLDMGFLEMRKLFRDAHGCFAMRTAVFA